jgi:hypothetical protein
MERIWKRCEGSGLSTSQRGKEDKSRSLALLGMTDSLKGYPPPPVFFVRVANKGVTGAKSVRVAGKRFKVVCFDVFNRWFVRVANNGVSHAGDENRVQARRTGKRRFEEKAAEEKRALRLESIGNGSMD